MELEVGNVAQIPPGEGRAFALHGPDGPLRVAVFHTRGGAVFATQADCPHRGGPLADGLVDEHTVVCPLHDRIYDLSTGAGLGNECSITAYTVQVASDGRIMLRLEAGATMAAE